MPRYIVPVVAVTTLLMAAPSRGQSTARDTRPVVRRGVFIGLDPGLAMRFDETGSPIYARLDLRVGGCFNPRIQLGVDWRMDILAANSDHTYNNRHTIGPVLTVFLLRGWFARPYVHLGGLFPVYTSVGVQTGYEFSWGKFAAVGISTGGDADILFNGQPPLGYTVFVLVYLSAYDLRTRRGRD